MNSQATSLLTVFSAVFLMAACAQGGGGSGDRDGGGETDSSVIMDSAADGDTGLPGTDSGAPGEDSGTRSDSGGGPITCTAATQAERCGSSPCVDGFCCSDACMGDCRGCNVAGLEGTCARFGAGTDPDGECVDQAVNTCGTTGLCDGSGSCSLHASGLSCNDGESCTTDDVCDGVGSCTGMAPSTCGPGAGNECCVGTCTDGAGCTTVAGACADTCGSTELSIGASCNGCGGAGGVGVCLGGGTFACDETDHNQCQEFTCGGVAYWCTNSGGSWAWRPSASCNDGDACTHTDTCGAGSCGGTVADCSDTVCANRECNGTATCSVTPNAGTSCDDGDPCTYGDLCDASATCAPGTGVTCANSPCIDRSCNGTAACTEVIRTGSSCEDGNACTYGEACTAGAFCTGGTTISCDPMDTTCLDYSCAGTATCASAARNVGGMCDDGNALTDSDVCRADGSCMGIAGCPPPASSCGNGSQNRRGCGNARVIGRTVASGGTTISDSTCFAYDEFDDGSGCWDANSDHAYRLYMRAGESVSLRYRTDLPCGSGFTWGGTLKIFENTGCGDLTCGTKVYCDYNETDQSTTYVAARDGWIIIVADGSSAFDDEGAYRLTVNLTCSAAGCGCS
ncbi:MAG: hypothetical protein JRH11_03665 [Deltaproteobacteria bacterium]|nr:hypothetical protein [Deltaproteobacteria bacterium]